MCIVRLATTDDLNVLTRMGERFLSFSPLAQVVAPDPYAMRQVLERLIRPGTLLTESPTAVWVAEKEGEVVGGLVAAISPVWFAPHARLANELAWWVAAEHRGGTAAIKLHAAFERWAKVHGAHAQVLSDLVVDGKPTARSIIERLGYLLAERSHIKRSS